jgi:hypothetical protein
LMSFALGREKEEEVWFFLFGTNFNDFRLPMTFTPFQNACLPVKSEAFCSRTRPMQLYSKRRSNSWSICSHTGQKRRASMRSKSLHSCCCWINSICYQFLSSLNV